MLLRGSLRQTSPESRFSHCVPNQLSVYVLALAVALTKHRVEAVDPLHVQTFMLFVQVGTRAASEGAFLFL